VSTKSRIYVHQSTKCGFSKKAFCRQYFFLFNYALLIRYHHLRPKLGMYIALYIFLNFWQVWLIIIICFVFVIIVKYYSVFQISNLFTNFCTSNFITVFIAVILLQIFLPVILLQIFIPVIFWQIKKRLKKLLLLSNHLLICQVIISSFILHSFYLKEAILYSQRWKSGKCFTN
jgi:hypothetical protein